LRRSNFTCHVVMAFIARRCFSVALGFRWGRLTVGALWRGFWYQAGRGVGEDNQEKVISHISQVEA